MCITHVQLTHAIAQGRSRDERTAAVQQRQVTRFTPFMFATGALLLPLIISCGSDSATVETPPAPTLFTRFVVMGSSASAGFESGGIVSTSQTHSWPALVAQQAGAAFVIPTLAAPGCPAPIAGAFPAQSAANSCAGRIEATVTAVDNVAVPGERLSQAMTVTSGTTHTPLIGAQTQVQAMQARKPTLLSVELGSDDVLAAALSGDATLSTTPAAFQASVTQLVAQVRSVPSLLGVVVVAVVDPIAFGAALQPGAFYFLARDAAGRFSGKPVNANCSPVTAVGQPNALAKNLIATTAVTDPTITELNCDPASGMRMLLTSSEMLTLQTNLAAYNVALQQAASANGWAFIDLAPMLQALVNSRDANGRTNEMRKCQDLAAATTASQLQAAVLNTCPITGPTGAPNVYGNSLSFDGVHPSAAGAKLIANAVIPRINAFYNKNVPIVP